MTLRTSHDWTLLQSFLAVAETGSLSAAAKQLGHSQPTLGRHIETLETNLSATLFTRHPRGLHLTETGTALLPDAKAMRDAMARITIKAAGQSVQETGTVRITASVLVSHYILPDILSDIRRMHPEIQLDLVPSDDSENLLFREADIAVRMYRPTQLDVITQHVADAPLGAYAAKSYIARRGMPTTLRDLLDHDLIGYDTNALIIQAMTSMGFPVTRDSFAVRCDNQATYWELVRAGCGIGFSQRSIALSDPKIIELSPQGDIPPLPIWLTAHNAMRQTPRIRTVWDALADGLKRAILDPSAQAG